MASWLPWVAYFDSASARAWVLMSGSVYVYCAASPLMNRGRRRSRTASRRESSLACAAAACGLERLDLGVELAEPGLGVGQVGGRRVGAPARVGEAAVVGARARRDHDEAQQHGEGEGSPAISRLRTVGGERYKMLRTCDETASKALFSGRLSSRMSPTRASITSSRVAMPRVRPSASATTATWTRACCMARRASSSEVRLPSTSIRRTRPSGQRAVAGGARQGEQVLGVDEARGRRRRSSPATSSRVWPDATTSGLGLGRRGRAGQPHDAVARAPSPW